MQTSPLFPLPRLAVLIAATIMVLAGLALGGAWNGYGPFEQGSVSLVLLQGFVGLTALLGLTFAVMVAEHRRGQQKQEREIAQLERTLNQLRTLRGLLPICASCKKIKNDFGHWDTLEFYLMLHSEATFTHGFCPDCMGRLYPNLAAQKMPPASMQETVSNHMDCSRLPRG